MEFSTKIRYNVEKEKHDRRRQTERLKKTSQRLSAQERRAIKDLLQQTCGLKSDADSARMVPKIIAMAEACARTNARRASDKATDFERRTLVGARVKREDADRYREAAQATGRSLYRFVVDALEAEAGKAPNPPKTQDIAWSPLTTTICCSPYRPPNPPGPAGGGRGSGPVPVRIGEAGAEASPGPAPAPPPPPARAYEKETGKVTGFPLGGSCQRS